MPDSISSIVYKLKHKYIWTICMWSVTLIVTPQLIEQLGDYLVLGFATGANLMLCGAMPLVKGEKNIAHNVFGILGGILSLICTAVINYKCLALWALYPLYKILQKNIPQIQNKETLVAEIICILSTCAALLFK